jgi:hypothetical protein
MMPIVLDLNWKFLINSIITKKQMYFLHFPTYPLFFLHIYLPPMTTGLCPLHTLYCIRDCIGGMLRV